MSPGFFFHRANSLSDLYPFAKVSWTEGDGIFHRRKLPFCEKSELLSAQPVRSLRRDGAGHFRSSGVSRSDATTGVAKPYRRSIFSTSEVILNCSRGPTTTCVTILSKPTPSPSPRGRFLIASLSRIVGITGGGSCQTCQTNFLLVPVRRVLTKADCDHGLFESRLVPI